MPIAKGEGSGAHDVAVHSSRRAVHDPLEIETMVEK
jgi:hypothetical protein